MSERLASVQLWLTMAVVGLAPTFFGSVDLFWIALWTVFLSIAALLGPHSILNSAQTRAVVVFVFICAAYALIAVAQTTPSVFTKLNDPIWKKAAEVFGTDANSRISSHAKIPRAAMGHSLLFAMAVVNGFWIGTSRRQTAKLIRFIQAMILLAAVYALISFFLMPNMLLWVEKTSYGDSLTTPFVNHNTAATFFGAGTILWFCSGLYAARSVSISTIRSFIEPSSEDNRLYYVVFGFGAAVVCLFALLETGSRGGLICSCFGLLISALLMIVQKRRSSPLYAILGFIGAFTLVVLLISRTSTIIRRDLFDEARWSIYSTVVEAIKQRPLLGTGLGTFQDIFPAIRSNVISGWGVWEQAHSTILEIAFEMGLPMAILCAVQAIAALFIVARAAITNEGRKGSRLAAIAGIAGLSYSHSTIDFSLQIPGYLIMFGVLIGCGVARGLSDSQGRPAGFRRDTFLMSAGEQ